MKKYGIFLGRFQPFHLGHQSIIDKIKADGRIPVVIKGSAQEFGTTNNPYHPLEVMNMINLTNTDIIIMCLDDADCWDEWYASLTKSLVSFVGDDLSTMTIYLHDKLEDLQDFTFRGEDYLNESYSKLYEVSGMHTTKLALSSIQIRAKAIREDLEANKEYLDEKVYNYIKELNEI